MQGCELGGAKGAVLFLRMLENEQRNPVVDRLDI